MNYKLNTFVISIGEHLAAITRSAPWMNNQPINHGQAYQIFSALHEEIINEMFSWANIDNSVQDAIASVYTGYAALVPAEPKHFRNQGGEWRLINRRATAGHPVTEVPLGAGLPNPPIDGMVYRVHGGRAYADWLQHFVDQTLGFVRWALRAELDKYLGTSRDYEWYYEYSGNGIIYTRQNRATISYVQPELPSTELEKINEEITFMPKPDDRATDTMIVNMTECETRGGKNEVDKFTPFFNQLPFMVSQFYNHVAGKGHSKAEILIRYCNPMLMREVHEEITRLINRMPMHFTIKSEQFTPPSVELSNLTTNVNRALLNRSIEETNRADQTKANALIQIRDRIVKRNNVTELDITEINSIDRDVLHNATYVEDPFNVISDRSQWYKFNNANPAELQQPVLYMAITLSNAIDTLLGNVRSGTPIPTFNPAKRELLISAIPLYGK
ncbi:hypothetical protein ACSA002_2190 [Salmonella phage vB_SalM_SA002]|nr:hypothetical protein ACSA002_2190 [Salmonella phage vB_SalM_SA002]